VSEVKYVRALYQCPGERGPAAYCIRFVQDAHHSTRKRGREREREREVPATKPVPSSVHGARQATL